MSKGIVLFGINNSSVDYVQLAVMCAAFIKKNMPGTSVALITDTPSKCAHDGKNRWALSDYFEHVILLPEAVKETFENKRIYRDTRYHTVTDRFRNEARSSVYDLSPYDETLLMDTDYLVCNDTLNLIWGSSEDVMINKNAIGLMNDELNHQEFRLSQFGIKMYWATLIYFKKGPKAKMLFGLVDHIKENWDFYKLTYDFPGSMFRNDYAFSIAIHILNGFVESNDFVVSLPDATILTGLDTDQLFAINGPSDVSLFANDKIETWKFYATRLKGLNVHCMNKISLLNNMESIMETLQ